LTSKEFKYQHSDAEMVRQAKQNRKAFALLYEKYFEQIYRFVHKRVGDEQLAGDLTQDAMLKAMLNINKYTDRGFPFSAWLYRIASNEVNLFYRNNKKRRTVEIEEKDFLRFYEVLKPEDEFKEEYSQSILNILNGMKPAHIEIMELRFFMGYSFKAIADFYMISEANAKMRVYRIVEKIRKKMS
jgi:RNA polymerase sigma-70 factor (ECF subfamily)